MRRLLFVVVLAGALITAPAALAITFGEPDGNRHPTVGAIIIRHDDGTLQRWCSGVMVSERVFITAGHCIFLPELFYGAGTYELGVTFMPDLGMDDPEPNYEESDLTFGVAHLYPAYDNKYGSSSKRPDVGLLVLDSDPGVGHSDLPTANLLDGINLKSTLFTAVGYGYVRTDKSTGPASISDDGIRRFSVQSATQLSPTWLKLSMNPSTANGGVCNGDSGGPHFLGAGAAETSIVVALVSHGDTYCRNSDWSTRVDHPGVLSFITSFIED